MRRVLALCWGLVLMLGACTPTTVAMGPPTATPQLTDDKIVTADGTALPLTVWKADGKPRAVILAVHGFNDYSNAFAEPAPEWAARGITTYAYDQRGFGRAGDIGLWAGTETLAADVETATGLIARRHPGVPLYVLGESMGGAVVMVAGAEHRLSPAAGIILVAPAVRGRETLNMFDRAGLWLFAHTVPWLAGQPGGPAFHYPSDNIAMLRKYSRDPLIIKNTRIDAVWGLVNLMDAGLDAARRLDEPALIQIGGRDDLIPGSPTKLMIERLPPSPPAGPRRIATYANGYHMLLRDLDAELPTLDIAFWVLNPGTTAALPSGAEHPPAAATGDIGAADSVTPKR
jgi:alpha-beta hydrolase superfamily lysophospholipase